MSFLIRLLSALVLGPVVIGILYYGGLVFTMFTIVMLSIALYEFWNLSRHEAKIKWRALILVFGMAYCALSYYTLNDLRNEYGFLYTGLIIVGVWASDIGGYLFGRLIGGRKLAPSISPNKTIAGLLGACFFPAIILYVYLSTLIENRNDTLILQWSIIASILIGVVGQMGDLFISVLKRRAGLKDTGKLIPGHGGVLDRIDALMLVIIVFWALLQSDILLWP